MIDGKDCQDKKPDGFSKTRQVERRFAPPAAAQLDYLA
jgi:hypothetical protein